MKVKKTLFTFLALILCLSTIAQSSDANPVGDTIRKVGEVYDVDIHVLTPPMGFDSSSYFNGYIYPTKAASILMNEIADVGYFQMENGMHEGYFAANNFEFISKSQLTSDFNTKGLIYKLRFDQSGMKFIRYMVFAGDETHTLWMHITYPEKYALELDKGILESLQSINYYPMTE